MRMDEKGRVVIHKLIREELGMSEDFLGDYSVEQEVIGKDKIVLTVLGELKK